MVKSGKTIRLTARYFGVNASTVSRWVKKSRLSGSDELPTLSSRPKNPRKVSSAIVEKIRKIQLGNTYENIIKKLAAEGVKISRSSVKRYLK